MNYCLITYEPIADDATYSANGLRKLAPALQNLAPLTLTAAELREDARARTGKMSVQGVQDKLIAVLKIKEGCFQLVDQKGLYILKMQNEYYPQLPENEAITMKLAEKVGIDVPVHGLVRSSDNSLSYFIKRFDRRGKKIKIATEDFTQLSHQSRETKYNSSMEKVIKIIEEFCTFPRIELASLFRRTLFNFLIGNEDMHLKNFSVITQGQKITLSPAYDLLNTTIAQKNVKEEIALPLNGKKSNLSKNDLLRYFPEKLTLNSQIIEQICVEFQQAIPHWQELLQRCFLSQMMKETYLDLLHQRVQRLGF